METDHTTGAFDLKLTAFMCRAWLHWFLSQNIFELYCRRLFGQLIVQGNLKYNIKGLHSSTYLRLSPVIWQHLHLQRSNNERDVFSRCFIILCIPCRVVLADICSRHNNIVHPFHGVALWDNLFFTCQLSSISNLHFHVSHNLYAHLRSYNHTHYRK